MLSLSPTILENFVDCLSNCWQLVMQPKNLPGIAFGNTSNLSTNSLPLRPLQCGAHCIDVITNSWLIKLNPLSVVGWCLIYILEKLSDQRFHVELLLVSPCKFLSWNPSICFEFQTVLPPAFRIPVQETPSPSKILFQDVPMVGNGYFLESPNNSNLSLTWHDFSVCSVIIILYSYTFLFFTR